MALTGGIACGKSLVACVLREREIPVCEADELAHEAMEADKPVFQAVVRAFGAEFVGPDGEIDRKALGRRIFASASARAKLNAIVHPSVGEAWRGWMKQRECEGARMAAVVIPLLYEVGEDQGWDAVVCVSASPAVQMQRLLQRGLTAVEAKQRIAAQLPLNVKMERADYVLVNDTSEGVLREQVRDVLEDMLKR